MSHHLINCDIFSHQGFIGVNKTNHYNEDCFYAGKKTFAVIDGATSLVSYDMNGLNTSAYMSQFLATFFAHHDEDEETAIDLLKLARSAFYDHLKQEWPEVLAFGKLGPSAAVAVVKIHDTQTISVANISDASIVISTEEGLKSLSPHSKRHAELDAELGRRIFAQKQRGLLVQEARALPEIKEFLEANRNLSNVEYGVFNAEEEVENFLHGQMVHIDGCTQIGLFTDGFLAPEAKGDEEALLLTMKHMQELGVSGYYKNLKELYDSDPAFSKFNRLKHIDDTTGMLLTFDGQ